MTSQVKVSSQQKGTPSILEDEKKNYCIDLINCVVLDFPKAVQNTKIKVYSYIPKVGRKWYKNCARQFFCLSFCSDKIKSFASYKPRNVYLRWVCLFINVNVIVSYIDASPWNLVFTVIIKRSSYIKNDA